MSKDRIFIFHGLLQSAKNLSRMKQAFKQKGYAVYVIDYPSRDGGLSEHLDFISKEIERVLLNTDKGHGKSHFVGFSLGGVLTRLYLEQDNLPETLNLGRVVFIGSPMRGTKLVDFTLKYFDYKYLPLTRMSYGPTILQLAHDHTSLPKQDISYDVGTITGTAGKSIPIAWAFLKYFDGGYNDGRVSEKSSLTGFEKDHIRLPAVHFYMPQYQSVINQSLYFIEHGHFNHAEQIKREYMFLGKPISF